MPAVSASCDCDDAMTEPTPIVQLQNAESRLTICPEIGAAIARYTWKGHDVLRRAPDAAIEQRLVRQMGMYPLIPYSNRIGRAKLLAAGQTYALRPNFLQEPHAIHGFGWQRAWRVGKRTADSAEFHLTHASDADWPFACEATHRVQLAANGLQLALAVKNTDARPMPAGLGFHPFFPLVADTHLQTDWKGMWNMAADSLPIALGPVPPEADFSQLRPVAGWKVDNCFTGWSRRALLDYPTHRVQIDASDACRQIVVFAPNDGRNFIALEPVTNINNAFALAEKGVADTGMRMLAPGEAFDISMSITMTGRGAMPAPHA